MSIRRLATEFAKSLKNKSWRNAPFIGQGRRFAHAHEHAHGGHGHDHGHGAAWRYREPAPEFDKKFLMIAEGFAGFMWWWVFWHLWHDWRHLFEMYPIPDPSKWTDEELGIPPDDAEDPVMIEPERVNKYRLDHHP